MNKEKVTLKNTKNEILDAYNDLLKSQEKLIVTDRTEEKKEALKTKKIEQAHNSDKKGIIHKIAELKIEITNALDSLGKSLMEEKVRFDELREARSIEEEKLKELYEITTNAKTLEALLLAQKKKEEDFEKNISKAKEEFEKEITQQRERWDKEKLEREIIIKDEKDLREKSKKREEDEYNYKLQIRNQKDEDEHQQKKLQIERKLESMRNEAALEIENKLKDIKEQEQEIKELRAIKQNYDTAIKVSVDDAKSSITKELETKYKYEAELNAKESQSKIELLTQTINSLSEKLSEKDKVITYLEKNIEKAHSQSQDLAKKVVDSISKVNAPQSADTHINNQKDEHKSS